MVFKKGYKSQWSEETLIIHKLIRRKPIVYALKDLNAEEIEGTFYKQELQRVRFSLLSRFKIDTIIKTRGKRARNVVYVSWKG